MVRRQREGGAEAGGQALSEELAGSIVVVARMKVRRDAAEAFRNFEHGAAQVMRRHGGTIERTVEIEGAGDGDLFEEIHLVRFPSLEAFDAYRADPELGALRHLRDTSVVATDIAVGKDGPRYG